MTGNQDCEIVSPDRSHHGDDKNKKEKKRKMKITKATFKSFIKKNKKTLQVWIQAEFDGMTDCVQSIRGSFEPMQDSEEWPEHNLGIKGIWLVNGGRDYFSKFEENGMVGIKYFNSCGRGIVAIPA